MAASRSGSDIPAIERMSKTVSMQRSAVIVAATSVFGLVMALYVIRAAGGAWEPDEPPSEVPGLDCGARADQSDRKSVV